MSASGDQDQRLLTFEVAGSVYAIPISGVFEVADVGEISCIPTVDPAVAGVINHHGDALPVVRRTSLLDLDVSQLDDPQHILVISDRPTNSARLGLPVDRVLGLVDGAGASALGTGPVAERRTIDGRVASVLDPQRLVARAEEIIEGSFEAGE
jgi:chemotaxis signal transduction protein